MVRKLTALASFSLALAGCNSGHGGDIPGNGEDHTPFSEIAPDETVRFLGTEPFWGGEATGSRLIYTTPENTKGVVIDVSRFAGRGGLSFSGELNGAKLTLAVTPGACSDGMSDRTFPFAVTVQIDKELREGCGWTERQPWKESK